MALLQPTDIAHDSTLTLDGAPMWLFGVMQSSMFNAWVRTICGRLKSDIRLAPDMAYNAFPFDSDLSQNSGAIELAALAVLKTRDSFQGASLADLYDPLTMPPALVKAHDALDKAVELVMAPGKRLRSDSDRLSVLFERYQTLTTRKTATTSGQRPKRSAKSS